MENKIEQAVSALEENKENSELKWLTFWLDKQLFGVSITNMEQIVSMQPVTEVPEYPPIRGLSTCAGQVFPSLIMGKAEMQYTDHTCIIINHVDNEQMGVIVDEVDAVIDIPGEMISSPPKMGDDGVNRYLTGIARVSEDGLKEKIVLCLNVAKVLRDDEFQALNV